MDILRQVHKALALRASSYSTESIRTIFGDVLESTQAFTIDPNKATADVKFIDINNEWLDIINNIHDFKLSQYILDCASSITFYIINWIYFK